MNYSALLRSALVALLRNKMRSVLTVLGITIGIAAVICVVAIGKAGQARVEQQLNNLGDNFVWIEAGGRAVNGVRTGTHDTKTLVYADAIAVKNQVSLIKSVSPNVDDPVQVAELAVAIGMVRPGEPLDVDAQVVAQLTQQPGDGGGACLMAQRRQFLTQVAQAAADELVVGHGVPAGGRLGEGPQVLDEGRVFFFSAACQRRAGGRGRRADLGGRHRVPRGRGG